MVSKTNIHSNIELKKGKKIKFISQFQISFFSIRAHCCIFWLRKSYVKIYFRAFLVNSVSVSGQECRRGIVSHLNARLEIIPLGHFLVLCRGNFSPTAQLLLGIVQVKDRHGIQFALQYQTRQVLYVVLPAGKSTQNLVVPCTLLLHLPRSSLSCNVPDHDHTNLGVT